MVIELSVYESFVDLIVDQEVEVSVEPSGGPSRSKEKGIQI